MCGGVRCWGGSVGSLVNTDVDSSLSPDVRVVAGTSAFNGVGGLLGTGKKELLE